MLLFTYQNKQREDKMKTFLDIAKENKENGTTYKGFKLELIKTVGSEGGRNQWEYTYSVKATFLKTGKVANVGGLHKSPIDFKTCHYNLDKLISDKSSFIYI